MLWLAESPDYVFNSVTNLSTLNNYFNWTMSYRRDSTFYIPWTNFVQVSQLYGYGHKGDTMSLTYTITWNSRALMKLETWRGHIKDWEKNSINAIILAHILKKIKKICSFILIQIKKNTPHVFFLVFCKDLFINV